MTDPGAILFLESVSTDDAVAGRSEAPALLGLLRLIGLPVVHIQLETMADWHAAVDVFTKGSWNVVHISAHGCAKGFWIGDALSISWRELFKSMPMREHTILSLSSCEVLQDQSILDAACECPSFPRRIFGYEKAVAWDDAALSSMLLMRAWRQCQTFDVAAAMASIYLSLGVDIVNAIWSRQNNEYCLMSGSAILSSLVPKADDQVRGKVSWVSRIIDDRGLLTPETEISNVS